MIQPDIRRAVASASVQPGLGDDAPASSLHPTSPPDTVLAALQALVESHHARLRGTEASADDAGAHKAGRDDVLRNAAAIGATSTAADLELLVRDALRAFQFGEAPGISIAGPGILVRPAAARLAALVFHELTTNAIKFGALGGVAPHQALQVAWKRTARGVEVEWKERGVAILSSAERPRSGFGKQLIEQTLASYSGSQPSFHLLPGGFECRVTIPRRALLY